VTGLDRARQRHLLTHPEEATADDVSQAMLSLLAMREAVARQAQVDGGVSIVVISHVLGNSMRCTVTAPAMSDERVAEFTANLVLLMGDMGVAVAQDEVSP